MARVKSWPPRFVTPVPAADLKRSTGLEVAQFIETVCTITQDTISGYAGSPMVLRPWQKKLLQEIFARRADGRLRHRLALIGEPRKNGKSGLAAGLALDGLFDVKGAEVYSAAADKDQAKIVFGHAKKMVEASPELSKHCTCFRDTIEGPNGSIYKALSSESFTKEGLSPTRIVFDELHAQPTRELFDVLSLAQGVRLDPLLIAITTAGVKTDTTGEDSICYELYQIALRIISGEHIDPTFYMAWWGAPDKADYRDESVWADANPGLDDLLDIEDMRSAISRTRENEFRTKRLNQWVSQAQAWLPAGSWDATKVERPVPDGAAVVLAFDGSFNNDSTGLTVHEIGSNHIDVAGVWEKEPGATEWEVPMDEVETTVREAFTKWSVRVLVYDPRIWQQLFQKLKAEGYPCEEIPQGRGVIKAAQRFYEEVTNRKITQSGNPTLARHIGNAVVKPSPDGPKVQKEAPNSPRKIDLAIAAIMGHAVCADVNTDEQKYPGCATPRTEPKNLTEERQTVAIAKNPAGRQLYPGAAYARH